MDRKVVITGIGLISSLGDSPEALSEALCNGKSGIRRQTEPTFEHAGGCHLAAVLSDFTGEKYLSGRALRPLDRISQLAAAACDMALRNAGWSDANFADVDLPLVLGTMFGGMHTIADFDRTALVSGPASVSPMAFANTVINAAAGQTAIWHKLRGANSTVATGSTSGISAIGHAAEMIQRGKAAVALAGGVDEFSAESFLGFGCAGFLCTNDPHPETPVPFDARRNGFALGEGAGILVLENLEHAKDRGAEPLAELRGYASAFDPSRGRESTQTVNALARAMRIAIQRSGFGVDDVGFVSASANGSVLHDCYELLALWQTFGERAEHLPVTAIKSGIGETLGASGALQIGVAFQTLKTQEMPGIIGLDKLASGCPMQGILPNTRSIHAHSGLINGVGLDGNCCSLVIVGPN
jgi:3-oxoacyl-[acyl-carrier-protein] synthase II